MTLDLTALGLSPVPSQENVDTAANLFNTVNAQLKSLSNTEDSVSGKAARDEILADANLSDRVNDFLNALSHQVTEFMNENEGASVHIRGAETFSVLKRNVSDRANEDISEAVAKMNSESTEDTASRDAQILDLKAKATELKAYRTALVSFAAQFKMELNAPELDKISGPRLSTAPKVVRTPGRKPRIAIDGEMLPEGTSFYSAVKNIRGDKELSAETVQDAFKAAGHKFGKDECEFSFNGHTLTVHPLAS